MSGALVVVGASVRALAECAGRVGWRTPRSPLLAVDAFGDDDTRAVTDAWQHLPLSDLARPARVLRAIAQVLDQTAAARTGDDPMQVLLGGGFDGRPDVIEAIASRYALLNNLPPVWRAARAPMLFVDAGIPTPETRLSCPARLSGWLCKRPEGSAGIGVRLADVDGPIWQRRVAGRPASLLFCAHRDGVLALGFNRQWCSPTPGLPFRWGGVASRADFGSAIEREVLAWATRLAGQLGLRGLNSLDFVVGRDGQPWALEINPRPSASVELYDRDAPGLLALHRAAVRGEPLPNWQAPVGSRALAVVYAERPLRTAARPAAASDWRCGARIRPGAPLCSIHAVAPTAELAARRARRAATIAF